jgi:hypothetical protein
MHKRQAANTVVGYTRNGGTVYGDGRIVMPNGATIYPGPNGQYPWGQAAYYNPNASGYTYDPYRTGRYDRTGRHCRRVRTVRYRDTDYAADRYERYAYNRAAARAHKTHRRHTRHRAHDDD